MSKAKDTIGRAQSEAGASEKHDAQTRISSTDKDILGDRALDDVAGGTTGAAGGIPLPPRGVGGPGG